MANYNSSAVIEPPPPLPHTPSLPNPCWFSSAQTFPVPEFTLKNPVQGLLMFSTLLVLWTIQRYTRDAWYLTAQVQTCFAQIPTSFIYAQIIFTICILSAFEYAAIVDSAEFFLLILTMFRATSLWSSMDGVIIFYIFITLLIYSGHTLQ